MPYFDGIAKDKLKAEYRRLAQKMHPDKGGDTKLFQDMKREYEQREAGTYRASSSSSGSSSSSRKKEEDYYYWKSGESAKESWNRKYEDDFDEYFRGQKYKPKREPKYHKSTVNFWEWMHSEHKTYEYDNKVWRSKLDPRKKRVDLYHGDELWVVVDVEYTIQKIKIVAREENKSKQRGWVIAEVYADGVYVGMYVCDYRELQRGTVRFDKRKLEQGFKQVNYDMSLWGIASCTVEFERWKAPDDILGKFGAWIERKFT